MAPSLRCCWVWIHLDIEGVWHTLADTILYHGFAGAEMRALSAVDMALWDLMGQFYNAPLYHLLGGRCRERVPVYNTCTGYGPMNDYATWQTDAGALAKSLLDDGIRVMKIWPFDPYSRASHGNYISLAGCRERACSLSARLGMRWVTRWKLDWNFISAGIAPAWSGLSKRWNPTTYSSLKM